MLSRHSHVAVLVGAKFGKRGIAQRSNAVVYSAFGSPKNVLKMVTQPLEDPSDQEVRIKFLAASLNPADLNMIEGTYPISPEGEIKTGGNEGVAVVEKAGANAGLQKGDWVIPRRPGFGTWRTHAVVDAANLRKVRNDLEMFQAASMSINPCTAYRLLRDFEKLEPGDVVLQNGCNGAVGQCVIQLANMMELKTVNILRDRPHFKETVEFCKSLGADIVIPDGYVRTPAFRELISDLPAPKLALNAIGGQSATDMSRLVCEGGTMVTYGGMSRKPVVTGTGSLIFKDLKMRGFWLSKWTANASEEDQQAMLDDIQELVATGRLRWDIQVGDFEDIISSIANPRSQYTMGKMVFQFPQ